MLITRASEYAILSLLVLAKADRPLGSEILSKDLEISKSFLAKILQSLAKNGILISYKGANGGFMLAKKPDKINMLDVMLSVEGKTPAVFNCTSEDGSCPKKDSICSIWPFFNKLQNKIDNFFQNLTLADILEE